MNTSMKSGRSDSAASEGDRGREESSEPSTWGTRLSRLPEPEPACSRGAAGGNPTAGAGRTTGLGGAESRPDEPGEATERKTCPPRGEEVMSRERGGDRGGGGDLRRRRQSEFGVTGEGWLGRDSTPEGIWQARGTSATATELDDSPVSKTEFRSGASRSSRKGMGLTGEAEMGGAGRAEGNGLAAGGAAAMTTGGAGGKAMGTWGKAVGRGRAMGQWCARWPEPRHQRQRMGSRQSSTTWSEARQRKQPPRGRGCMRAGVRGGLVHGGVRRA
jgi:hypothetical protein